MSTQEANSIKDLAQSHLLCSIVVPIYNVERYLRACIDSLLAQSYTHLEIILVDDGATDTSGDIADSYLGRDERIQVVHRKNGGLSAARNSGIELVTGDFITFIDSDDYVDRDFIQTLMQTAITHEADIAQCESTRAEHAFTPASDKISCMSGTEALQDLLAYKSILPTAWGKLYRAELFKEHGVRFPEGKIYEDTYTVYKLCYHARRVACADGRLYFYRKNDAGIMSKPPTERDCKLVEDYLVELDAFIAEHDIDIAPRLIAKQRAYRYLALLQRLAASGQRRSHLYTELASKYRIEAKASHDGTARLARVPVRLPSLFLIMGKLIPRLRKFAGKV